MPATGGIRVAVPTAEGTPMGAYVVAFLAMSLAAVSAFTLIYTAKHFDPPGGRP